MEKQGLTRLPQIEKILQAPELEMFIISLGRPVVTDLARSVISEIRRMLLTTGREAPPPAAILEQLVKKCRQTEREKLQRVINATGIILHTNMGRAPLPREVWQKAEDVNCGYSNLEMDLKTGKRGKRKGLIPLLLSQLTGAEDALVVNNNAAAVLLILHTFTTGKEVLVSRGEQVQIGGGFRIPEILSQSGARLVEVGTTNITSLDDYRNALTEQTAMILSVHRSNFAIRGFTSAPGTSELSRMKPDNVILCIDQGSGVIDETLPGEISARMHLKNGADLVSFSGDKVFGGPQAGIIVGKKALISQLEKHPMMRAFRPGKTVYSLLELILIRRLNGIKSTISRSLEINSEELNSKGRKLLKGLDRKKVYLSASTYTTGGGSLPDETFPSLSVCLDIDKPADSVLKTLREATPPVIGMISDDKVHLNLATIQSDEIPHIKGLVRAILES